MCPRTSHLSHSGTILLLFRISRNRRRPTPLPKARLWRPRRNWTRILPLERVCELLCFLSHQSADRLALVCFASRIEAHVCDEGTQPSRRWLTKWDPVCRCQRHRSVALRLLPHITRRGKRFFHLCSGLCLMHQEQIRYIWPEKASFGAAFRR